MVVSEGLSVRFRVVPEVQLLNCTAPFTLTEGKKEEVHLSSPLRRLCGCAVLTWTVAPQSMLGTYYVDTSCIRVKTEDTHLIHQNNEHMYLYLNTFNKLYHIRFT